MSFPSERAQVAYVISHLSGRAEAWATAEWSRRSPVCDTLQLFTNALTKTFQQIAPGREAARALVNLRQGRRNVSDYAIEFRTVAADRGWNQSALFDAFLHGLSAPLKDQLAPLDLPADLDSVIAMAIRIDKRLTEREKERSRLSPFQVTHRGPASGFFHHPPAQEGASAAPRAPSAVSEELMQLGRTHLSEEER